MVKVYRTNNNVVSLLDYNFVFCTRYRRKIFENSELSERLIDLIKSVCNENEWQLLAIDVHADYCQLRINAQPTKSPSDIIGTIKRNTSATLRKEYKELTKIPNVWTKAFIVSTENTIANRIITRFIESQKTRS